MDLRDDQRTINELSKKGLSPITYAQVLSNIFLIMKTMQKKVYELWI